MTGCSQDGPHLRDFPADAITMIQQAEQMKKLPPDLVTLLKRTAVVIVLSLGTTPANADMLAVAGGGGNLKTHHSDAMFLSYLIDAPKLFNHESHYDITLGYWNGPTSNTALTLARDMRWQLAPPSYYFAGTLGVGAVSHTTDHLGTNQQFIIRLAVGRKFGKYDLSIGETHYSNGKYVLFLPWNGPNTGEDFLIVMLAREF